MVDEGRREAVHSHVAEAVAAGAQARAGGQVPEGPGAFHPPTVLTGVRAGELTVTKVVDYTPAPGSATPAA